MRNELLRTAFGLILLVPGAIACSRPPPASPDLEDSATNEEQLGRFASDDRNCGRCGNACAPGLRCEAGSCVTPTDLPNIGPVLIFFARKQCPVPPSGTQFSALAPVPRSHSANCSGRGLRGSLPECPHARGLWVHLQWGSHPRILHGPMRRGPHASSRSRRSRICAHRLRPGERRLRAWNVQRDDFVGMVLRLRRPHVSTS